MIAVTFNPSARIIIRSRPPSVMEDLADGGTPLSTADAFLSQNPTLRVKAAKTANSASLGHWGTSNGTQQGVGGLEGSAASATTVVPPVFKTPQVLGGGVSGMVMVTKPPIPRGKPCFHYRAAPRKALLEAVKDEANRP